MGLDGSKIDLAVVVVLDVIVWFILLMVSPKNTLLLVILAPTGDQLNVSRRRHKIMKQIHRHTDECLSYAAQTGRPICFIKCRDAYLKENATYSELSKCAPGKMFKAINGKQIDIHFKDDDGYELNACTHCRSEAVADFIVHACNVYYDLVEALEAIDASAGLGMSLIDGNILHILKSAIAKARITGDK